MSFYLGQRLSYSGELCTVKFIGEIPAWEEQQALGVEWDNASKGKHSGCYKDIEYFQVQIPNSGSFLKASKKHDGVRDFYSALVDTYADDFKESEIKIGSKVVESLGFDKLQRLQSDFHYLKDISLSRKQICAFDVKNLELVSDGLKNLEKLDLSFNLFEDFNDVVNILKCLNARKLKLIGNRFRRNTTLSKVVVESIESLDLSLTYIEDELLGQLTTVFPNLKELHLSDNSYSSLPTSVEKYHQITSINLSFNQLEELPFSLTRLPNLKSINLANNKLQISEIPKTTLFQHIETLNLRRNEISHWREVDQIATSFPNLTDLSINHNPLFDNSTIEESEYEIMARISTITQLNGVSISASERNNSELYFIAKVNDGTIVSYNKDHFINLLKLHNKALPANGVIRVNDNTLSSILVTLEVQYGDIKMIIPILQNIEVLKLRGILSRRFGVEFTKFRMSYEIGSIITYIDTNLTLVSSLGLEDGQVVTIRDITTK
ncbi:hypothetical protein WICPIJ_005102 [Wickerhamomyces pijperi]|uniref:CAP-Gly domain-containing protein n=1 Tax=Wickerhamomyces pijperi TaxID=599730 RepID=A0A9P8Q4N3_WICPI|nr:hypothetical protein WICPIJ_005102 [Wickerhamomyces pijperi]